jgi:hypothetical protein
VGNFEKIGGVLAHYIAAWDGTDWCGFGTYFDNRITQITFYNDTMYVAGGFWSINGDSISYMAKWIGGNYIDTCGHLTIGIIEPNEYTNEVIVYPNPSHDMVTFQFSNGGQSRELIIHDMFGREVRREETNESSISLSVLELTVGMYFYSVLERDGSCATGKFIVGK